MLQIPTTKLSNGVEVPVIGLGVYQSDNMTQQAVLWALEAGYRLIDAATLYGNEKEVGEAIRASGLRREEIFVTTKMWDTDQIAHTQRDALQRSLDLLGLDYVDLYLLHWPVPGYFQESWSVVEQCYEEGLTRAIGVSNFEIRHLEALASRNMTLPAVNQIELHPGFQQKTMKPYCEERNIAIEAWSPLGGEKYLFIKHPVICAIAEKHGRTPAQVLIRWHLQFGNIVIPKSIRKERIIENANVFDFTLDAQDMADIAALDTNARSYWSPDRWD